MVPYYISYIILFITSQTINSITDEEEKRNKNFCIVAFLVLFLLFALRSQTMGIDLMTRGEKIGYLGRFEMLNRYSWKEILELKAYLNYERGYIIFNKLVGSIWVNKQFFLTVCAFVSLFPMIQYIGKRSVDPLLSVVIFMGFPVFLMYFSGLRQVIAIGITVLSMEFIEKKKKIKFVMMVLLASCFHFSSILFFIAYPIYHMKVSYNKKIILTAIIPLVYVFRSPLFNVLSKILKDSAKQSDTGAFTLFVVFCIIYLFLIIFNKSDCDDNQNGMINLFYVACLCQAFSGVYQLAIRVGYYFMIYGAIAIPKTVKNIADKRESNVVSLLLYVVFISYGLYSLANGTWSMTNPYTFFWEG